MDDETLKRLALKALTNRQSAPMLVDLHPMLADLATAMANPTRKWPTRLIDWCDRQGMPVDTLDNLRTAMRSAVDEHNKNADLAEAANAYKRFAERLRGLAYGIESQLIFGPDYAAEWVRKADVPSMVAQLPKLPTPSVLKVV